MDPSTVSLDGVWEVGPNRVYTDRVPVPGLASDPTRPTNGLLWYRRKVDLPGGSWTDATLVLNGARFCPSVYVDGTKRAWMSGYTHRVTWELDALTIGLGQRYTGEMEDLLVVDRALSDSEVAALYGYDSDLRELLR